MLPFAAIHALFGLVIGSFLNVCIHRIPAGKSVVHPGSCCPRCGHAVRPWDNVPLLSYVWLGGRCRDCRAPISARYPAVELAAGLGFGLCALEWGLSPATYVNSTFVALILVLVFIDYDHQILPNVLTLPGLLLGIVASPWQDSSFYRDPISWAAASLAGSHAETALPWAGSVLGAVIGGGLLYAVAWLYLRLRHRAGLGMGDVKMIAMVGAFLGWRLALLTVFAGSLGGSLIGVFLILFRGQSLQTRLAFGTFLGGGAVVALFLGLPFLHWYVPAR
jgi:leader peptidase (prepilin peptidase)/N-methyltransferase